uniref:Non-specific serine/threonine protein kinase n=1 Tax=Panagrellus redivivus TaxID=6233 RepID=A0A7E4WAK9_PANRE
MASDLKPIICAESKPTVIHKGFLEKRGRFFKIYHLRYFILYSNGVLLRFMGRPDSEGYCKQLKNCKVLQVMKPNRPPPTKFIIEGFQDSVTIERKFRALSEEDRDAWYAALGKVLAPAEVPIPKKVTFVNPRPTKINGYYGVNYKTRLDRFAFVTVLGYGSSAKVILVKDCVNPKYYAMKMLKWSRVINEKQINNTQTESYILFVGRHPFLTRMALSFKSNGYLCFLTDYCIGGDLHYHLYKLREPGSVGFGLERTRFYAAEIACGLGYLHANNIIYRDLKLENVLLDKEGHIKIADFGLCKQTSDKDGRTSTICGTIECLAPETLNRFPSSGRAVDWWALGIIVYEMMCGVVPFILKNAENIPSLIHFKKPRYPPGMDSEARNFIQCLLQKNPDDRLGSGPTDIEELKAHPFFETINWVDLYNRNMPVPFTPDLTADNDSKYFNKKFTDLPSILAGLRDAPNDIYSTKADQDAIRELKSIYSQFSFYEERKENVIPDNYVEADEPMES